MPKRPRNSGTLIDRAMNLGCDSPLRMESRREWAELVKNLFFAHALLHTGRMKEKVHGGKSERHWQVSSPGVPGPVAETPAGKWTGYSCRFPRPAPDLAKRKPGKSDGGGGGAMAARQTAALVFHTRREEACLIASFSTFATCAVCRQTALSAFSCFFPAAAPCRLPLPAWLDLAALAWL